LRLAYDFLSSHAPYGAGLIQSVGSSVYKAKQIKQRYPKGYPSHHLQKTIDAAVRLLDLCQDLQSKTTLASATPDAKAEVDRAVEVLRKAIKTNTSEWEAKEATLQSSIVETMNSTVNLLKLLDESVGRGDESYLEERKKADLRATYAEYVCKHNDRLPKAAEAARHLLQFLAQTDKEANGTKRKAPEGDHEDVPTHGQKRTKLEDTCRRYIRALEGLQDEQEHAKTKEAVRDFLENDGPKIQLKLKEWAAQKDRNDPTPDRGAQLPRAASLIVSSLGFVHDLRAGILQPDSVRGTPLDMDQYKRLFGTSRIPTERGCVMDTKENANHIVVLRRGQFCELFLSHISISILIAIQDWFEVLDQDSLPVLTEREILRNLQGIVADADKTNRIEVARGAIGVLSTENRKIWSKLRSELASDRNNASCLEIVDDALFVVCLDDAAPDNLADLCNNFLCGTYALENGEQLQIIVCADGAAGINFEHTGVDGHTVLRFAADIFTEGLMLLARSINPTAPTLFHAPLSPHAKAYKPPKSTSASAPSSSNPNRIASPPHEYKVDTTPKKLEWKMSPGLRVGVRYAETRI
ncbi:hypothetical protein H0H93_009151, partial [Arthromyces matolae]